MYPRIRDVFDLINTVAVVMVTLNTTDDTISYLLIQTRSGITQKWYLQLLNSHAYTQYLYHLGLMKLKL